MSDTAGITPVFPSFNVSHAVDGVFVGFILSTLLLGVTLLQAWNYSKSNHDSWSLRLFVAILMVLDIGATVCGTLFIHEKLIEQFGNVSGFFSVNDGFRAEMAITFIVIFLVHLFFASRVHLLRPGNYWIAGTIVLTSAVGLGVGTYIIVLQVAHPKVSDLYLPPIRITVGVHQALVIISDVLITAVLSMHFIEARSESRVKWTEGVLHNLLSLIVTRGSFVTILDITFLIMWSVNPGNLDWMPIHLSFSKAYVITMLALLNARPTHRQKVLEMRNMTFDLSTIGYSNNSAAAAAGSTGTISENKNPSPVGRVSMANVLVTHEHNVYYCDDTSNANDAMQAV